MITPLNKSQRQRPNFPFSVERAPPDHEVVANTPIPVTRVLLGTPQMRREAARIKAHLWRVRNGETVERHLDGLMVIKSITTEDSVTFYHLTDEARHALQDGYGLPWGA